MKQNAHVMKASARSIHISISIPLQDIITQALKASPQTRTASIILILHACGASKSFLKSFYGKTLNNTGVNNRLLAINLIRVHRFFGSKSTLNNKLLRLFMDAALEQNDEDLLISVGRELASAPKTLRDISPGDYGSLLEWFLIGFWDGSCAQFGQSLPALNAFDKESLSIFCDIALKQATDRRRFKVETIEKTRQRLGLEYAKGNKSRLTYGAVDGTGRTQLILSIDS